MGSMPKKILVIRFSSLGDVVLAEPVFRVLKEKYPGSEIAFVTKKEYAGVFDGHPFVNRVLVLDGDLKKVIEEAESFGPEIVVDLHKNFRSAKLVGRFPKAERVSYPKARLERWMKVLAKLRKPVPHTTERYLQAIGGNSVKPIPKLEIVDSCSVEKTTANGFTIGFGLGAKWETKRWPVRHFVQLARLILEKFPIARIALFGSEEEYELGMQFKSGFGAKIPVVFVFGQPLNRVKLGLSRLDLLVSNDSGLMHLGTALGVPTLGLFGPTHPVLGFGPLGEKSKVVTLDLYCSPCSLHGKQPCFRNRRYCLEDLTPEKVLEEAHGVLHSTKPNEIPKPKPTVFLDRDGTVIQERDFDYTPENVEILPGAAEALKKLKSAGYRIVVISNQSGVGRGFFGGEQVDAVHRTIKEKLKANGAGIDRFYFCPHWPDGKIEKYRKDCICRKPEPGMLELANLEMEVDFSRSFVVGDRVSDMELGRAKQMRSILVLTGQGREAQKGLEPNSEVIVKGNILEAAEFILEQA